MSPGRLAPSGQPIAQDKYHGDLYRLAARPYIGWAREHRATKRKKKEMTLDGRASFPSREKVGSRWALHP